MKKYEYAAFYGEELMQKLGLGNRVKDREHTLTLLNHLGQEGWALVDTWSWRYVNDYDKSTKPTYLMMREKP